VPALRNIGLLATCRAEGLQGDIHPIPHAALAWDDGRIVWVGPDSDLPARFQASEPLNAGGRLVIPGLVPAEYARRLLVA